MQLVFANRKRGTKVESCYTDARVVLHLHTSDGFVEAEVRLDGDVLQLEVAGVDADVLRGGQDVKVCDDSSSVLLGGNIEGDFDVVCCRNDCERKTIHGAQRLHGGGTGGGGRGEGRGEGGRIVLLGGGHHHHPALGYFLEHKENSFTYHLNYSLVYINIHFSILL